jgi:hypothetical protein
MAAHWWRRMRGHQAQRATDGVRLAINGGGAIATGVALGIILLRLTGAVALVRPRSDRLSRVIYLSRADPACSASFPLSQWELLGRTFVERLTGC